MTTPSRPRHLFGRLAVAITAACAMSLSALPGLQSEADAAPAPNRCDEKWLGRKYDAPVAGSGIQGRNQPYSVSPESQWDEYFYDNPSKAFDGLKAPTAQQKKLAGKTEADINKWKRQYERTGNIKYRVLEIYARYNFQLSSGGTPVRDFSRWLDIKLIGNETNRTRGNGFEAKVVRDFRLVGPDWICQKEVPVRDPKTGKQLIDPRTNKPVFRRYDAYNARTKEFVEFKSNGKHIPRQLRNDAMVLRDPAYKDHKLRLITGEKTTRNTIRKFGALNRQIQQETGRANQVTIREQRSTGVPRYQPNQYTRYDKLMNPDPSRVGSRGPINDAAWRSADTPEQARQLQRQYNAANTRGGFGRGPGGVDFSTLELQYVGNPVKGKGLDYSFKADYVEDEDTNPGWGGRARLQLASDALFTWLALPPDKFWVNLNPDQPDKVMDKTFGTTDAGRVLLEADLEMKHDYAKDMDPRREPGKSYWDAMRAAGVPCSHSLRNWIVPKTAKVRVDDNGIYILDAPLEVKSEPMKIDTPSPNGRCELTDAQVRTSQRLVNQYVIPDVERKVNTHPRYADLRRVYNSRVAAEYIRQQDQDHPTDFRKIINSNDVSRWPLRGANKGWTPRQTYDAYVKSFTKGDYSYPCEIDGQQKTCVMGGVDFSKAPRRNISRVQFDLENPRLDSTTKTSVRAETSYRDTETSYQGGNGSGRTDNGGGGGTGPTPQPTPTGTGKPTDPASPSATPSPAPSTSAPTPAPTPRPKDPDGDLADTGSGTPVGLIAGIAAALAVAGGSLVWWMRRRKAME
ncbi:LPXTG cell wall anchor domain-containing protein [Streptomyces sp. S.PNR 29]|uniref:LPXTG cell wall anchor domain-containing protein n=1 Tax=Streptomyces sp. S.PNR 29 TaxID=2973805 RepID=UPI0025B0570D|nr:LPXTG cell wall anchor domain-containing protein [Streptomyces sp. S.PNR 29]MDN0196948.1 LPXTG cell wall anchor domain-containing protein [Streptomyces sp. S.PNR 29]